MGDAREAEPLMHGDRRGILGVDPADHHMLAEIARKREERGDHGAAGTPATPIGPDMNRVFHAVPVAGPGATPIPERGKADHLAPRLGDKNGISRRPARLEPSGPVGDIHRLIGINRGRVQDDFVENGRNRREIRLVRRSDHPSASRKGFFLIMILL
jgi:hypothetical protein